MDDRYTLVIPTFNRSASLARLLRYLAAHEVDFRIRILDSSKPGVRDENRRTVAALDLRCDYVEFPEEMHPFDKFREGIKGVSTPLCGLSADDDILIIDGLQESIRFLDLNPNYSVAHGYYFQFAIDTHQISVANITYYTPSYASPEPLDRLHGLMRHYQALTYGTYRTDVLNRIFELVRPVEAILARELLSSALAAVHGRVARLPVIFHGRNLGPSSSYTCWHPLEWLIRDPGDLFRDYVRYRDILLAEVLTSADNRHTEDQARRAIDLVHAQYLVRHAPDEAFDHIVTEALKGSPTEEIFASSIITVGLIEAAKAYRPRSGDGEAPFQIAAASPAVQTGTIDAGIRLTSASLVPAGSPLRRAALSWLRQAAIRLEPHAPDLVSRLRFMARQIRRRSDPAHDAGRVVIGEVSVASETASVSSTPGPFKVDTAVRRYVLSPEYLNPNPIFGVKLPPDTTKRLLASLDHYK